jgi:type III pantothenate kinase
VQLVIDIGNTRVKAALFEQNELKHFFVYASTQELLTTNIIEKYAVKNAIVGSVVNGIEAFITALQQKITVLLFTDQTPTPIKNCYQSAHTLGSDRLAGAVGGNALFPNENVLVIDAGTCIKYNFINTQNEYIGGAISPGLQMRLKAMHTFTSRLPLLEVDQNFEMLIGTNSNQSILSGAQNGAVAEIDGCIADYKAQYPAIKIVLTGGDVNFFEKRLKNSIFADPFLILKGLNAILEHNLKS